MCIFALKKFLNLLKTKFKSKYDGPPLCLASILLVINQDLNKSIFIL